MKTHLYVSSVVFLMLLTAPKITRAYDGDTNENEARRRTEMLQTVKRHVSGLDEGLKTTKEVFEEYLKQLGKSAEIFTDPTSSSGILKETTLKSTKIVVDSIEKLFDKMAEVKNLTKDINQTLWNELNCIKTKDRITENSVKVVKTDFRVVCYFPSYSFYKENEEKFQPENIDLTLCSHIVYAFVSLNPNTSTVYSANKYLDFDHGFYERVTDLKSQKPSLKVLLALGGWSDSKGDKYSRLVNDSSRRENFIEHVTSYLMENNFDGLDLDWEFPVCWQSNCSQGPASDKDNFALLIEELRNTFDKQNPKLLLSASVSAYAPLADKSYDIPRLANFLDYINVMTYDLAGPWNKKTGHHAAMYQEGESGRFTTVDYAMRFWVRKGAPKHKLNLGIPAYGRNFTLVSADQNQIGSLTTNLTHPSTIPYYEICRRVKFSNWTKQMMDRVGPFAYFDTQWVSYDDLKSISWKSDYVKKNEIGGMMIWDVSQDDFNALCCNERFPLLKAMNWGLYGEGKDPSRFGCE